MYIDFLFSYGFIKGWRVYIRSQFNYGYRDTSGHATHRLWDSRGTYICWDRRIATLDAARQIAKRWADCTALYVQSGDSFDSIALKLSK